jgi:2'-5' RNA ligase superfamily
VEVPEAEHAVRRHRELLDANARVGVPAHITVLFPFIPAMSISPTVTAELARLLATQPAFDMHLVDTAWFADEVLWLAPANPQPLRALTDLIFEAFPGFPPLGGLYDDPIPHLTVAHGCELSQMQAAEAAVREHLPVQAHVGAVTLLVQSADNGTWGPLRRFRLGPAAAS